MAETLTQNQINVMPQGQKETQLVSELLKEAKLSTEIDFLKKLNAKLLETNVNGEKVHLSSKEFDLVRLIYAKYQKTEIVSGETENELQQFIRSIRQDRKSEDIKSEVKNESLELLYSKNKKNIFTYHALEMYQAVQALNKNSQEPPIEHRVFINDDEMTDALMNLWINLDKNQVFVRQIREISGSTDREKAKNIVKLAELSSDEKTPDGQRLLIAALMIQKILNNGTNKILLHRTLEASGADAQLFEKGKKDELALYVGETPIGEAGKIIFTESMKDGAHKPVGAMIDIIEDYKDKKIHFGEIFGKLMEKIKKSSNEDLKPSKLFILENLASLCKENNIEQKNINEEKLTKALEEFLDNTNTLDTALNKVVKDGYIETSSGEYKILQSLVEKFSKPTEHPEMGSWITGLLTGIRDIPNVSLVSKTITDRISSRPDYGNNVMMLYDLYRLHINAKPAEKEALDTLSLIQILSILDTFDIGEGKKDPLNGVQDAIKQHINNSMMDLLGDKGKKMMEALNSPNFELNDRVSASMSYLSELNNINPDDILGSADNVLEGLWNKTGLFAKSILKNESIAKVFQWYLFLRMIPLHQIPISIIRAINYFFGSGEWKMWPSRSFNKGTKSTEVGDAKITAEHEKTKMDLLQSDIDALRDRLGNLTPEDLSDTKIMEEIKRRGESIQSRLTDLSKILPEKHSGRMHLEGLMEKFKPSDVSKITEIGEHFANRIRPVIEEHLRERARGKK